MQGALVVAVAGLALAVIYHAVATSPAIWQRRLIKAIEELNMSADARTQKIVAAILALPALFQGGDAGTIAQLQQALTQAESDRDAARKQAADALTQNDDNLTAIEGAITQITPTGGGGASPPPPPPPPPPAFVVDLSGVPTTGAVGTAFTGQATATGGSGTATLAAAGLPDGVTMDANGAFGGTPTVASSFTVIVTATDGAADQATASVSISISG